MIQKFNLKIPLLLLFTFYFNVLCFAQFKVVGYYPDWIKAALPPNKIEFENLDYLIHAFAWPDSNGTIKMYSGLINHQLNQAVHAAKRKILISFGGFGQSDGFGPVSADSSRRAKFIDNVVNFLSINSYDGIDLDWENPSNTQQKIQLTYLIKEMRRKFDEVDSSLLITMAVPAGDYGGKWIEYEKLTDYVDWFAIMAYDFHGSWSNFTGPNAPLYQSPQDRDNPGSGASSVQYMVVNRKVSRDKILLGVPFYGREFNSSGMYKSFNGSAPEMIYSDITSLTAAGGWKYNWDNVSKVPYYLNNDSTKLITFDDTTSIRYKVEYSINQNLAGIMIWALGQDIVNGKQPLLENIGKSVGKVTSVDYVENEHPDDFLLYNNYPNPFNPITNIKFRISSSLKGSSGPVSLKIYDVLGRELATLVNEEKPAGEYEVKFDADKYHLSSGIYFYTLVSGGFRQTNKMMYLK